jgi:hypothetical protein
MILIHISRAGDYIKNLVVFQEHQNVYRNSVFILTAFVNLWWVTHVLVWRDWECWGIACGDLSMCVQMLNILEIIFLNIWSSFKCFWVRPSWIPQRPHYKELFIFTKPFSCSSHWSFPNTSGIFFNCTSLSLCIAWFLPKLFNNYSISLQKWFFFQLLYEL